MHPLGEEVFNPLDKTNLAASVRDHLLKRTISSLPPERFTGAGIYAIYYVGSFPAYQKIAKVNPSNPKAIPIYVGKAVPPGARKGGFDLTVEPGDVLYRRLMDHVSSITQAKNLDLNDFKCRFLLVDDIWIPLGESLLIETFKPVWNLLVDGFGHHDQGSSRTGQKKSAWDTLHPGRKWAEGVLKPNSKAAKEIEKHIISYLENQA
jgi:hypothetical protein